MTENYNFPPPALNKIPHIIIDEIIMIEELSDTATVK